jgi:hypothetical protein
MDYDPSYVSYLREVFHLNDEQPETPTVAQAGAEQSTDAH